MSYHLGTVLARDSVIDPLVSIDYGWWMISDPAIAGRLREAGLMIPPVDPSEVPAFAQIVDRGSGGVLVNLRSPGKYQSISVPAEMVAESRAKLAKVTGIPTFRQADVDRMARLPAQENTVDLIRRGGRFGPFGPVRPVPAELPPAAPPSPAPPSVPSEVPATPPAPSVPPAPPAARTETPARGKSNTGLYLGLGAGALLLLVGLGYWPKSR